MSESENKIDKQELAKNNVWTAIVLGVIALFVAILPFFLLQNMGR